MVCRKITTTNLRESIRARGLPLEIHHTTQAKVVRKHVKERGKVPLMAVYRIRLLYAFLANQYLFEYVSCKIMVCNGSICCVRIDRYTRIMKSTDALDCSKCSYPRRAALQK